MWRTSSRGVRREKEAAVISLIVVLAAAVAVIAVVTLVVAVAVIAAAAAAVESKWPLAHKELSVESRASLLWMSNLCKFVQAVDLPLFFFD